MATPAGIVTEAAQRIVVFGMPDAGKTSLLGALAQVGLTQANSLGGHLQESGGLSNLRHQLYEENTRETQQEIVSYPIKIAGSGPKQPSREAVIIDCDGRAVNDILTKKNSINQPQNAKQLAEAILTADSLIFVVDASAPRDLQDRDFHEFARFLKHFEKKRADEHGVGGLPVFLVLSKCDKISSPTMNAGEWQKIIEDRCHDAARRFRQVLTDEPAENDDFWKFGSIDFHVRPCAVKRPKLTDLPEQSREPYGVAELFNEVLGDASSYRQREEKSKSHLSLIIAGISGLLGSLAVTGSLLFLNPVVPEVVRGLSVKVDALQTSEGQGAASRLASGVLDKRLKVLQDIQNDPEFDTLSEIQKNYIRLRLDEGHSYLKYWESLQAVPPLSKCRSLAELAEIEKRLTSASVPAAYRSEWVGTDAVLLRERILTKDIPQLRSGVTTLTTYFHALKNRASNLLLETTDLSAEWERKSQELVDEAEKSRPFPKGDPLLGPAYLFDDVTLAEADWQKTQRRLGHVRDLATALGLLGNIPANAPLAPMTHQTGAEAIASATRRYQALKKIYPECHRWTLADMPDAVLPEFQKKLKRSVDELIVDGQRIMQDRLKTLNTGATEVAANWPRVGEYLITPSVQDWRELTNLVYRLYDPNTPDLVETSSAFLRKTSFDFQFKRLTIKIPDTLTTEKFLPTGELIISSKKTETSEPTKVTLTLEGDARRDQQNLVYTFVAKANAQLPVQTGDIVVAELNLKNKDVEWKFTWNNSRTLSYQFEVFQNPPRLHDAKTPPNKGVSAVGVVLTVTDGLFTPVPAMIPNVRTEKP